MILPNKKGTKTGRELPRTVSEAQHARGAGGNPRPGADFWSIDPHFGRQKCFPNGVPKQTWKMYAKKGWEMRGFGIFQNYALCNEFMTFTDSEKVEISMPKWIPQSFKNQPKSFQKSIPRDITFSIDFSIDFSSILAPFWKPTWTHVSTLGPLGGVLAASWGALGPSWKPLGASWRPRPTRSEGNPSFGSLLRPSWPHFWKVFG